MKVTMRRLAVFAVVGLVAVACSSRYQTKQGAKLTDPNSVTPPAVAGTVETLAGTTWELEGGKSLTFGPDGGGSANVPGAPPLPLNYTLRDDGVISVIVGEAGQAGTWDGTNLVLEGRTLTRAN